MSKLNNDDTFFKKPPPSCGRFFLRDVIFLLLLFSIYALCGVDSLSFSLSLSLTVSLANYFILFYLAGWIENILKTYLLIQCSQYFVIVTHHSKPTHTQKNENEKHVIKLYSNCDWMNIRRRRRRQSGCRWSSIVVVAAAVVQCPMLKTFRQQNKNVVHTSMLAIFNCHNFRFDVHLNSRK